METKLLELTEKEAVVLHMAVCEAMVDANWDVNYSDDPTQNREAHINVYRDRQELAKKIERLFPWMKGNSK